MPFIPRLNREELRALKVEAGDLVTFEGHSYIAAVAGLKYLRLEACDGSPSVLGLVHRRYVHKLDEQQPKSPLDDFSSTELFDYDSLLGQRNRTRRVR